MACVMSGVDVLRTMPLYLDSTGFRVASVVFVVVAPRSLIADRDLSPARSACWRSCSILANAGVESRDRDLLDFFEEEVLVDPRDTDMMREDDGVNVLLADFCVTDC